MIEWIAGGIVAALVALVALVTAWWRGKSAGKRESDERHARETLERASRNAQERQHVEDDVNRGDSSAADRLRNKWQRD